MKHINNMPLAARLRPGSLSMFVGQPHLLGPGKPLRRAIESGSLHSMILWGPPGTGKTTLAQLLAQQAHAHFERLSAISSGVKEIRQLVDAALARQSLHQRATILFVDEVHRFNKSQQDVFLPYVEDGTFILIGATTENPSFELNSALLSRARVYVLKPLTDPDLLTILHQALSDEINGLGSRHLTVSDTDAQVIVKAADGDARQLLNILEVISDFADEGGRITQGLLEEVLQVNLRRFDKQGEAFYDQISALHKSVRGSSPDAALYWFSRMIDGGCDPRYIGRRVIRMAIEDIGLADPKAVDMAVSACDVYERLGSPEGELALAQAIVYLACLPKSNAVYQAFQGAMHDVKLHGSLPVPLHLCNAPTKLMKQLGYGAGYRYAHDEPEGYASGEQYLPDKLTDRVYYQPVKRGLEEKIAERLAYFREQDKKYKNSK